ncbi:MAG TPA: hemolysin family protein [Candidatus Eubacterium faecigallinarum]|nr:hemolysin family protein [Candidatus Eubacterium faecigallinarum]
MDIPIGWQLFIQAVLIAINAVFASAEIAIVSMNEIKLEKLAEDGNKRAKRLLKLTSVPTGFLSTIQIAITLSGFLGSAFAADNFSDRIVDWLVGLGVGINPSTLNTVSVIVITIILSYLTLVFGELVPKRVAMKKTEQIALGISGLIYIMSKMFTPIVWLLTVSTNLVLRMLRIDPHSNDQDVSEEEIRMLVDMGSQKGIIDKNEQKMIVNVFEFDDKDAGEFSTHRKEILAINIDDDVDKWEEIITKSTHSMYPVYKNSIDNVVAVLDSKKFFRIKDRTHDSVQKYAFVQPIYVPETMKIDVLFGLMQQSHNHFAVVLDEYGGTVGIITMNDLLEQLVGDLDNDKKQGKEIPDIIKLTEKSWKIKGSVSLDEVAELTKVELPVDTYETLSGYIFGLYCTIPNDGTQFSVETDVFDIRVLNVKDHTVSSCIITKKQDDGETDKE